MTKKQKLTDIAKKNINTLTCSHCDSDIDGVPVPKKPTFVIVNKKTGERKELKRK